jgi:hypothetical protein
MANQVATHISLGVFAGSHRPVRHDLWLGVRGGLGGTLVGFANPSFQDVLALNLRVEAQLEWALSQRWRVLVRPVTLDFLNAAELGGPILTYQFRVGVAFHFGIGSQAQPRLAPPEPSQPEPSQPEPSQLEPSPPEPSHLEPSQPVTPAPTTAPAEQPAEQPIDPWAPPSTAMERFGSRMLL